MENLIRIINKLSFDGRNVGLKINDLVDREVYVESLKVGKVKDILVDDDWKVSHLDIELTKEAAKEVLGVNSSARNILAVSALGPISKCCSSMKRIDLKVSKGQLRIYLSPSKE